MPWRLTQQSDWVAASIITSVRWRLNILWRELINYYWVWKSWTAGVLPGPVRMAAAMNIPPCLPCLSRVLCIHKSRVLLSCRRLRFLQYIRNGSTSSSVSWISILRRLVRSVRLQASRVYKPFFLSFFSFIVIFFLFTTTAYYGSFLTFSDLCSLLFLLFLCQRQGCRVRLRYLGLVACSMHRFHWMYTSTIIMNIWAQSVSMRYFWTAMRKRFTIPTMDMMATCRFVGGYAFVLTRAHATRSCRARIFDISTCHFLRREI